MKKHDFSGKKVVITGASTGIGRALATEFAKKGAVLGLNALPREVGLLTELADRLKRGHRTKVSLFPADLLAAGEPDKLYRAVREKLGVPYCLVNNAGTIAYGRVWETPYDAQERIYRLNLLVAFRLMHLFVPDMVREGRGVILNVSSVSAFQPTPFHAVYGSAKTGLQMLSEAMRAELKGTGVSVCTLNPPYTDTALLHAKNFPRRVRWYTLGGGLRSPEWVAKKGIRALGRDKFLCLPGLWPKFLHLFLNRISPRRLINWIAWYTLQGTKKSGTY
jgi:short-subunit dehydrogenase